MSIVEAERTLGGVRLASGTEYFDRLKNEFLDLYLKNNLDLDKTKVERLGWEQVLSQHLTEQENPGARLNAARLIAARFIKWTLESVDSKSKNESVSIPAVNGFYRMVNDCARVHLGWIISGRAGELRKDESLLDPEMKATNELLLVPAIDWSNQGQYLRYNKANPEIITVLTQEDAKFDLICDYTVFGSSICSVNYGVRPTVS